VMKRLQAGKAHVPALWLWETANLLVQAERRGRITPAAGAGALIGGPGRAARRSTAPQGTAPD
jgi:hypothetical protein